MRKGSITVIMTILAATILLFSSCGDTADTVTPTDTAPTDVSSADVTPTDVSATDAAQTGEDWLAALSEEERPLAECVIRSAQAVNDRDIEAYMATVDPQSEVYASTREDAEYVLSDYRLAVSVDKVIVDELKGDSATVTVTQTTVGAWSAPDVVSGSDVSVTDADAKIQANTEGFKPCITVLVHRMTRCDGVWYITSTVINSYREINTQWDLLAAMTAADPSVFSLANPLAAQASPSDAPSQTDAQ